MVHVCGVCMCVRCTAKRLLCMRAHTSVYVSACFLSHTTSQTVSCLLSMSGCDTCVRIRQHDTCEWSIYSSIATHILLHTTTRQHTHVRILTAIYPAHTEDESTYSLTQTLQAGNADFCYHTVENASCSIYIYTHTHTYI